MQGVLQLASLSGTVATGERAGKRVRKVVVLGGKEFALGPRCALFDGYNLHANVAFAASDRGGLERLCRYVLRPPLAVGRIERPDDGRVRIGMKRVWSDGTSGIELSPVALVEKLAAIVPLARANQVLYAGVLHTGCSLGTRGGARRSSAGPGPMRLRTVVVGPPASTTIVTRLLRSTGPPMPRRGGDDQGVHAGA